MQYLCDAVHTCLLFAEQVVAVLMYLGLFAGPVYILFTGEDLAR